MAPSLSPPTDSPAPLRPGATYKFIVRSADEAVRTIKERLGENAKVLSVRQVPTEGFTGLFAKPKLEVIAQVPEVEAPVTPSPAELLRGEPRLEGMGDSAKSFAPSSVSSVAALTSPDPKPVDARRGKPALRGDTQTSLPELLRRSGFSESVLGRLQATAAFAGHEDKPLHHSLSEVGRALRRVMEARKPKPLPNRSAFLGTPGVGRTTALCK